MSADPVAEYLKSIGLNLVQSESPYTPDGFLWLGRAAIKLCEPGQGKNEAMSVIDLIGQKLRDALVNGQLVARFGVDRSDWHAAGLKRKPMSGRFGVLEFYARCLVGEVQIKLGYFEKDETPGFVFLDRVQFDAWLKGKHIEPAMLLTEHEKKMAEILKPLPAVGSPAQIPANSAQESANLNVGDEKRRKSKRGAPIEYPYDDDVYGVACYLRTVGGASNDTEAAKLAVDWFLEHGHSNARWQYSLDVVNEHDTPFYDLAVRRMRDGLREGFLRKK